MTGLSTGGHSLRAAFVLPGGKWRPILWCGAFMLRAGVGY